MSVIYRYKGVAGGGPVLFEAILTAEGTTSVFLLHHQVPRAPDETVPGAFAEAFSLCAASPPASGTLYLKPVNMSGSANLLLRVVQGGRIVANPAGGHGIDGGTSLAGTILDIDTGNTTPIIQDAAGQATIGPLTAGAEAFVSIAVRPFAGS